MRTFKDASARPVHPPSPSSSSSFTSLLKVHNQSKLLLQTVKQFLLSVKIVLGEENTYDELSSLVAQLKEFVLQCTAILIIQEGEKKESVTHRGHTNGGVGDSSSPRRGNNTSKETNTFYRKDSSRAVQQYTTAHDKRRTLSPVRQTQTLHPQRRTIINEVISTLIQSIQAFPVSQYLHIHIQVWQAILSILLQRSHDFIYSKTLSWDDNHWNLITSLLSFNATNSNLEPTLGDEVFKLLVTYSTQYLQWIQYPPTLEDGGTNETFWIAHLCIIYSIFTLYLVTPSSMNMQQQQQHIHVSFVESVILPLLHHTLYYDIKSIESESFITRQKQTDILNMVNLVSIKYITRILEDKATAMALLAIPSHPHNDKESNADLHESIGVQELDYNWRMNNQSLQDTLHASSFTSSRKRLREAIIEPLCNILIGDQHTTPDIFYSTSTSLTLLFDQIKWIESNQQKKSKQTVSKTPPSLAVQRQHSTTMTHLFRWIDSILQQPQPPVTLLNSTHPLLDDAVDDSALFNSQNTKKLSHVLTLLLSLIRCPGYDPAALQFWSTFYPASLDSKTGSLTSLISSSPPSSISSELSINHAILALTISQEYIKILPHRLWSSPLGSNYNNQGHLWNRVHSSLKCLVDTSCLTLSHCMKATLDSSSSSLRESYFNLMIELSHLIKVIVTVVPFNPMDTSDPKSVLNSTMAMLQIIGGCMLDSFIDDGLGQNVIKTFIQDLSSCMGGSENPDGTISPMPIPTQQWVLRDAHKSQRDESFLLSLLHFVQACLLGNGESSAVDLDVAVQVKNMSYCNRDLLPNVLRLLICILRASDEALLNSYSELASYSLRSLFLAIISALVTHRDNSLRLMGTQIIQALLKARQSEKDKFSRNALLPKLPVLLEDNDVDVKRCTLSIVGSLSIYDWEWIHSGNSDDIFHRVLSYCLEYSGPAHHNLRCDACKALGNIISVILAAIVTPDKRYSTYLGMIEDSIIVSVSSLNDSQADVRGMALFTIGNVASVISTLSLDLKFKETLLSILESVAYRLDDGNEKVVVNAIRTVGHLFHALASSLIPNQEELQQAQALCIDINLKLAARIEVSLVDTCNSRNAKQRNFINKHSWGSCTSLASLLNFCDKFGNDECKFSSATALIQVVDCIRLANVINEKISCCALSTLHLLSKEIWLWGNVHKPILGRCMANCVYQHHKQLLPKACMDDVDSLMKKTLLLAVEIKDVHALTYFLKSEIISSPMIDIFYQWMVEDESFHSTCFDYLGSCLINTDNADNVSLVQKFYSRSALISRMEMSTLPLIEDDEL